jgi:multidrug efflux system membrane fusion protein
MDFPQDKESMTMTKTADYIKKHSTLFTAAALLIFSAIGGATYYASRGLASAEPQVVEQTLQKVEVATIQTQNIRLWTEFSGRLEAIDRVDVRPRVGGTIAQVLFEEGALVKKGAPLFVIDPRPYKAALEHAKATLQAAESDVRLTKAELERAEKLVEKKLVSESRYDSAQNAYKVSLSKFNAAKAGLTQAELNYEYAHIDAPVSGRVSRAEITLGNVIETGPNAPVLTSIVSSDKLYAEFDVDEQTYLKTIRAAKAGKMPVEVSLTNDDGTLYRGVISSFDNRIDPTSGTIRARAILANTDGALVPGMHANIRLGSAQEAATLLVSEKAIGTDQSKRYVYVVTEDNEVAYREVQLGRSIDGNRVVTGGIKSGEKVLVNSLQRVRPGMKVEPIDIALKESETINLNPVAMSR